MKERQYNGQTFENTKGVIRRHKLKKDIQYNGQKFEDTKWVIRSLKLKRDNDRQSTEQKTKE